jgi:hypothetical protein
MASSLISRIVVLDTEAICTPMRQRIPSIAAWAVALLALGPVPAHALYIDPGAGSLLVQIVISAMLGVTFFFHRTVGSTLRSVRHTLLRVRRRITGRGASDPAEGRPFPQADSEKPL